MYVELTDDREKISLNNYTETHACAYFQSAHTTLQIG